MPGKFLSDYMSSDEEKPGKGDAIVIEEESDDKPSEGGGVMKLAEKAVAGDPLALVKLIRLMTED
jgi:hypothetical protein